MTHPVTHQLQKRTLRGKVLSSANYLWQLMADQIEARFAYFKIQPLHICLIGPAMDKLMLYLQSAYPESTIATFSDTWVLCQNRYDVVIINGVLAWFDDPAALLQDTHTSLKEGGLLLFSALGPDTLMDVQTQAKVMGWHARSDALVDLHHWGDCLLKVGYKDPVMDRLDCAILYHDPKVWFQDWQRMQLKDPSPPATSHCITPHQWQLFLTSLPRQGSGQWEATFEIIQGHAWAQGSHHQRSNDSGEVTITLDTLRAQMPSHQ